MWHRRKKAGFLVAARGNGLETPHKCLQTWRNINVFAFDRQTRECSWLFPGVTSLKLTFQQIPAISAPHPWQLAVKDKQLVLLYCPVVVCASRDADSPFFFLVSVVSSFVSVKKRRKRCLTENIFSCGNVVMLVVLLAIGVPLLSILYSSFFLLSLGGTGALPPTILMLLSITSL